ncbi:uncharacterized protein [Parasteatoda tepidariorum]|uniref:uncharacterized protein n=1 Tax=Parasteatoda tepidariorum TaxID=114398 RepID=UPI001C72533A|nr:uncharacterized protein LOC107448080 [Parasteatoda tepidariorum]
MKFGTWNILSLYRTEALQMLLQQLDECKIDLTAIQEIRWAGKEVINKRNHTVFFSCHPDHHKEGTGFIVSKRIKNLVMNFIAVSPRLCVIRIRGQFFHYSIICAHAPTEDRSDDEKETFYEELDKIFNDCPRHDRKLIIGDLNAKVGKESEFHSVIATWRAPDESFANQIDHVLIEARHYSNLLDVRTYKGANVDSDHFLVISKVRERISVVKNKKGAVLKEFNCDKLNVKDIKTKYINDVEAALTNMHWENDSVESKWLQLKEKICNAADNIIGKKEKNSNKDWFDDECAAASNTKNIAYKKMIQKNTRFNADEYRRLRREEKRIHKSKKKAFEEENLRDIESLKTINESRVFYRRINRSRMDFKQTSNLCKSKDGLILTDKQAVLSRWSEHFQEMFSKHDQSYCSGSVFENKNNEDIPPPELGEVDSAIKKLKSNWAGQDSS